MDTTEMLELSQEFATIGAELRGAGDRQAALRRIVDLAVKHVQGCTWASITALRDGQGHTVAATDEVARQVDALQYRFDEGPCLSAAADATDYLLFDIETDQRWPDFARATASRTPVRSVLAYRLAGTRAAALNLYADQPGALSSDALDTAAILAALTASLVSLSEVGDQATQLEAALESSRSIGMALGVLMSARKLTQEQAFTLLRTASQQLHRKLRAVAAEVVETGTLPDLPAARPGRTDPAA